jgi:hypothetical protein
MNVDAAATRTRMNLERLLDVVEARERSEIGKSSQRVDVLRPLCRDVDLDFVADEQGRVIGPHTNPKKFARQIAVCDTCNLKQACLQRAIDTNSEFGIWGGTLPAQRRRMT